MDWEMALEEIEANLDRIDNLCDEIRSLSRTMSGPLKRKRSMPPQQRERKSREGKKKKKKNELHLPNDMFKHWNKLPQDLLRAIMERVTWVDRIRTRTVCKDWLIPINGVPHHPFDRMPWMMTYSWSRTRSICKLIDPFQRRRYIVEKTSKQQERLQFVGAKARASRNGWVLLSKKEQNFFPVNGNGMLVFAFCPFTDEVVQLPEFEGDFQHAAFSTAPTLPDCVFFLVSTHRTRLEISTCRPGDKTWTRFVYNGNFSLKLLDMNYADGNFYCVFQRGIVGAFNIILQEWNLLSNVRRENSIFQSKNAKMVATREELLLTHYSFMWRFDLLLRQWERVKEIRNRTVFLGTTSFVIPAAGMLSKFSSKAYYFGEYSHKKGPIEVPNFMLLGWSFHHPKRLVEQTAGEVGIIWIEPPLSLCSS